MKHLPVLLVLGLIGWSPSVHGEAGLNDILFRATFDGAIDAQIHQHAPSPKLSGPEAYQDGRFGQALVVGEQHATVVYATAINLDTRRGSLSFWFRAVDWEPSERRSHVFARLADSGIFRIYTNETGELAFEIGPDLESVCRVSASLKSIDRGAWTHVVATWSEAEARLYVNGQVIDMQAMKPEHHTYVVNGLLEIGDQPRARGRNNPRTTLIDDLTIYARPLTENELARVNHEQIANAAPAYEPPVVTVGPTTASPDGQHFPQTDAWDRAAGISQFLEVGGTTPAALPTNVRMTYDAKCLYLRINSPVLPGVPLRANSKYRDDSVWTDDAVQVYLTPPNSNYRFALIFNSEGAVYDRREHIGLDANVAWNGDYRIHNTLDDNEWTLNLAIPFEVLSTSKPTSGDIWRFNVTRDRTAPQSLTSWAQVQRYTDWDKHGYLRFTEDDPVIRLQRIHVSPDGHAQLDAHIASGTQQKNLHAELTAIHSGMILAKDSQAIILEPDSKLPVAMNVDNGNTSPSSLNWTVREGDTVVYRTTAFVDRPSSSLQLKAIPKPSEGYCQVSLVTDNSKAMSESATLNVTLIPIDQAKDRTQHKVAMGPLSEGRATGRFAIDSLLPGRYELSAKVLAGGKQIDQTAIVFVKPQEPWRGAGAGKSETPPPPWQPITCEKSGANILEIGCWNRHHRFEETVLPTQIRNESIEMLTSPIRLDMRVEGEHVAWHNRQLKQTQVDEKRVSMTSKAFARDLKIDAESYIEFDGLMWFEITVQPRHEVEIDQLDLVIPLDAKHTTLRHLPWENAETGSLGQADNWSWSWKLPKAHFMWLGDNDQGLTWFYERLEQFNHADPKRVVSLTRESDTMAFRIHYVGKKTKIKEPLKLAFGLQATPVKPRPSGWRSLGAPRPIGDSISILWTGEEIHRYGAGYPEATNASAFRRRVAHEKKQGYLVAPYVTINFQAVESPQWQYNQDDWALGSGTIKYHDHRPFWWGAYTDNNADSFADYIAWKIPKYIRDNDLDGVYHDLQWSYRTRNGDRAFRGDRQVNMRLYTALKSMDPPAIKIDHASATLCSVYHGFSDIFVSGEEMCLHPIKSRPDPPNNRVYDDYFNNMRLDYFRASGAMGRQWGTVPMFLMQMVAPSPTATESLYAILLAHDAIPTWDAYARDVRYQRQLWRTLETFGIGDDAITFLPFWREETPAKISSFIPVGGGPIRPVRVMQDIYTSHPEYEPQPKDAYGASIYSLDQQRSLIVAYNFSEDDADVQLDLDLPKLGLNPQTAVASNAHSRLVWTKADRPLKLRIKKRNCRLIWVESRDALKISDADLSNVFPDEIQESILVGDYPAPPVEETKFDERIAGDATNHPWENEPVHPSAYLRSELAQIFKLDYSSRVNRFEIYIADSLGPRINRVPIDAKLVRVTNKGIITDEIIADESSFAPDRQIPSGGNWRTERFELLRPIDLAPGRYALVLCKPLQFPREHFHIRVPVMTQQKESECIATRILNKQGEVIEPWEYEDQSLPFGVFGWPHSTTNHSNP